MGTFTIGLTTLVGTDFEVSMVVRIVILFDILVSVSVISYRNIYCVVESVRWTWGEINIPFKRP